MLHNDAQSPAVGPESAVTVSSPVTTPLDGQVIVKSENVNKLPKFLQSIALGQPLEANIREDYYQAAQLGLIRHLSHSQATDLVRQLVAEGKELTTKGEQLRSLVHSLRHQEELAETIVTDTAQKAYDRFCESELKYQLLIRESRSLKRQVSEYFNDLLIKYPRLQVVIGPAQEPFGSQITTAMEGRLRDHSVALELQGRAIQSEVRLHELVQEIRSLSIEQEEVHLRLNKVEKTLATYQELQANCFGYAALTDLGKTYLRRSSTTLQIDPLELDQELAEFAKISDIIRARVSKAVEIKSHLEDVYQYPPKGAEIASWYLLDRDGAVAPTVEHFHEANRTVLRYVRPSYSQLLLSLEIQSMGDEVFSQLTRIISLSNSLPNFDPSQRYLVARELEQVEGDHQTKQDRLHAFTEKLTSPLGEHLSSFEKFEIAAKLAQIQGNPTVVYQRFENIYNQIRAERPIDIFKCMLASVLLTKVYENNQEIVAQFKKSLSLADSFYGKGANNLILECAFIAMFPGEPENYFLCLDMAREQLEEAGFSKEEALARALPASVLGLRAMWKSRVNQEAISIAHKVAAIDQQLENSEFEGLKEEIRRTRLEEELLISIERIHALYGELNSFNLGAIWKDMARAATGKDVLATDLENEKKYLIQGENSKRTLTTEERLSELLEAEENLQREQREAELGSEHQT
jgi:hypothetical protein